MKEYILGMIVAGTLAASFLAGFFLRHPLCFFLSILVVVVGVIAIAIIVRVK